MDASVVLGWGGPIGIGIFLFCLGIFFLGLGVFINFASKVDKEKK